MINRGKSIRIVVEWCVAGEDRDALRVIKVNLTERSFHGRQLVTGRHRPV